VIEGDYRIDGCSGGCTVVRDVHISRDMNVSLVLSLIRLEKPNDMLFAEEPHGPHTS